MMGNKDSSKRRTGLPTVLEKQDLSSVAKYIQSGKCKNIFLMLGAGVSTSAGIPDFRSPETGLYSNLARLNLPFPEAVFEINFFRRNPIPFYTLAQELYPGRFRPTPTHSFIRLLSSRSLLHTCFTQNIDTLERRAGVPERKIIEAHGSFATQRCVECKTPFDDEKMKKKIMDKAIPRCERCNGLVKPDIVFFGEALPPSFHKSITSLLEADLLIIIGTSLTVHPFASLVDLVPDKCPRVLINIERVGNIGDRRDDVICLGKCDDIVRELCRELEWEQELEELWRATDFSVEEALLDEDEKGTKKTEVEKLEDEVEKLTREVEQSLVLAKAVDNPSKEQASSNAAAIGNTSESSPKDQSTTKKNESEQTGESKTSDSGKEISTGEETGPSSKQSPEAPGKL